ncbi:unnamed protein product, partial [Sphenostylis stenocarpa]
MIRVLIAISKEVVSGRSLVGWLKEREIGRKFMMRREKERRGRWGINAEWGNGREMKRITSVFGFAFATKTLPLTLEPRLTWPRVVNSQPLKHELVKFEKFDETTRRKLKGRIMEKEIATYA